MITTQDLCLLNIKSLILIQLPLRLAPEPSAPFSVFLQSRVKGERCLRRDQKCYPAQASEGCAVRVLDPENEF